MRMNEFMKDEDKNELLQLLNQFFASKFAAPQAQPNQPSQPKPIPPPNKAISLTSLCPTPTTKSTAPTSEATNPSAKTSQRTATQNECAC